MFTSERDGSAELYRIKLDDSGLTRLTSDPTYDDQASLSPDDSRLVFVSTRGGGTADLWILHLRTLAARRANSNGCLAVSKVRRQPVAVSDGVVPTVDWTPSTLRPV